MLNKHIDKVYRDIGFLSDTSLKHRRAVLIISALMISIDPDVVITFGKASLGGFSISANPPQDIKIWYFMLALLFYRLVAFWASALIESGKDIKRAVRKARDDYEMDQHQESIDSMDDLVSHESHYAVYKWSKWQVVWEIMLPNVVAGLAVISSLYRYIN